MDAAAWIALASLIAYITVEVFAVWRTRRHARRVLRLAIVVAVAEHRGEPGDGELRGSSVGVSGSPASVETDPRVTVP